MKTAGNHKILLVLIVALLATNLGMLWYFTHQTKQEAKPLSRSERMAEMMKKELQFTEDQAQKYLQLRARRDSIMQPMNATLRAAKMEMLQLLQQPDVSDTIIEAAATKVGREQSKLEVAFFHHFRRVQGICQPNQLPMLDNMLERMVRRNTGDTTLQSPNR